MLGLTAAVSSVASVASVASVSSVSSVSAVPIFRIHEAADLLAVSDDTVRRWADSGRFATTTDHAGRKCIEGAVLARFAEELAASTERPEPPGPWSRGRPATGSSAWSPGWSATRSWLRSTSRRPPPHRVADEP
jgi:excisionase family DNA binding protein